jgi:phage baseplate assembly protein W
MAVGVSVKLPLQADANDGVFKLNKTIADSVKQNFKMLLLTNEGEKIMDINFGVGLKKELFENFSIETNQNIRQKIFEKTSTYLPFIKIISIKINSLDDAPELPIDANELKVEINYEIQPINFLDKLQLSIF